MPFPWATYCLFGGVALLIVIHHFAYFGLTHEAYYALLPSHEWGIPIVGTFFFLTGYGLCASLKRKGDSYLDGFFSKRLTKLLPVLVVVTAVMMVYNFGYNGMTFGEWTQRVKEGTPSAPYSWFIYAVIYVYAAFYLSCRISRGLFARGLVLACFILAWCVVTRYIGWNGIWSVSIPTVSVGYFVSLYEERILAFYRRHFFVVNTALILSLLLYRHIPGLGRIIMFEDPLIALAIYAATICSGPIKWKALAFVGGISLEVYVIHGALLTVLIDAGVNAYPVALFVSLFVLTILCAMGFNRAMQKRVLFRSRD